MNVQQKAKLQIVLTDFIRNELPALANTMDNTLVDSDTVMTVESLSLDLMRSAATTIGTVQTLYGAIEWHGKTEELESRK